MMVGQIETANPIQNCFITVNIRTRHKLQSHIQDTRFPGAQHFLDESEGENRTYQENKSRSDETTIPHRAKKQQNTQKAPFPTLITIPIKQPTTSQCQSPFLHPSPSPTPTEHHTTNQPYTHKASWSEYKAYPDKQNAATICPCCGLRSIPVAGLVADDTLPT